MKPPPFCVTRLALERLETVAKHALLSGVVGIRDHHRDERADAGGLRARRLGLRQDRVGDLVEQHDVRLGEQATARCPVAQPASHAL